MPTFYSPCYLPCYLPCSIYRALFWLLCAAGVIGLVMHNNAARADTPHKWTGTWFTCEFAKSRTAPHEGCAMFDDEGFRFEDGRLTYIRVIDSDETRCRGEKVGQCFARERPSISISTQDRGELTLGDEWITVRYFGCTQKFSFADTPDYREIIPTKKRCFWARKRHFYIARYNGDVTIQN
jgi:hypothetical protein